MLYVNHITSNLYVSCLCYILHLGEYLCTRISVGCVEPIVVKTAVLASLDQNSKMSPSDFDTCICRIDLNTMGRWNDTSMHDFTLCYRHLHIFPLCEDVCNILFASSLSLNILATILLYVSCVSYITNWITLLRLYSKDIGSEGLRPQLVCCAPFPSIAPYFRILYLSYLKIWMAIVAYPKVQTTIV
jgi:hypothetical protein